MKLGEICLTTILIMETYQLTYEAMITTNELNEVAKEADPKSEPMKPKENELNEPPKKLKPN